MTSVNGYRQEGFAPFDRNIRRGRRISAARAYLHPIRGRRNLQIRTRTLVTGLRLDGRRATGVEIERRGGGTETIRAGEVLLCGGAFNTPQLLQLAGIGATDDLRPLGIPVVADLPGVGAHPGPPRGLHPARIAPAGLDAAIRSGEMASPAH